MKTSGGFTEMMSMDSELSHDIVPLPASSSPSPRPLRQIVLTGATGFVGVHLLRELLTQTDAHVTCFVRAIDARQAAERIRRAMDLQRVSTIDLDDRVTAVPADLSLPRFGLTSEEFNRLSEDCDAIYHNAAIVSVVRDYRSLRAANVLGTREILRLASASRVKPLHYVSTLAVAPELSISPEIAEVFAPPHPGLRDGYKQSKWVAERLMEQASQRGLPVSVYRLGRVVGAPETGVVNENDLVFRLLRAGIPAGVLPDLDVTEAWTPVDYVGRAVVRLSLARPAPGTVFNLAPAPQIRLTEIFQWVRDYGYSVEQCSVPAWRARLASTTDAADRATLAFFDLQPGITQKDGPIGLGHVRCENVLRGLLGSGVECPSIDQALLHHYLDHCVETGWLPPRPAETHGRS